MRLSSKIAYVALLASGIIRVEWHGNEPHIVARPPLEIQKRHRHSIRIEALGFFAAFRFAKILDGVIPQTAGIYGSIRKGYAELAEAHAAILNKSSAAAGGGSIAKRLLELDDRLQGCIHDAI